MHRLADLLEPVIRPLLELLDRSGLFQTFPFSPLDRLVAALAAVVLIGYVISLVSNPLDRGLRALEGGHIIGRPAGIIVTGLITCKILSDRAFTLDRASSGFSVPPSNLGFIQALTLVFFPETRVLREVGSVP